MVTRALGVRFRWYAIFLIAPAIVFAAAYATLSYSPVPQLEIQSDRSRIPAGGSAAHLTIRTTVTVGTSPLDVRITEGRHSVRIARTYFADNAWRVTVVSKALPGSVKIALNLPPFPPASTTLTVVADERNPDPLRLDDPADVLAFRSWFTFLTEAQFFRDTATLPAEISDCAGLIRYAYREALREHDSVWSKAAALPLVPAIPSIRSYEYPYTPWGAAIFRTGSDNERAEFADAATLLRFNTHFIARDLRQARPGDLLFFHNPDAAMPYHSMVYLGPSQIENAAGPFVIYHTGPQHDPGAAATPGEIRRPSVAELEKHPDPAWHPVAENPHYLGVYRWNILRQ